MDIEGKQLFRQDEKFHGDKFLDFIKTIHSKVPSVICLWTSYTTFPVRECKRVYGTAPSQTHTHISTSCFS
jgi:hypothetical protein